MGYMLISGVKLCPICLDYRIIHEWKLNTACYIKCLADVHYIYTRATMQLEYNV